MFLQVGILASRFCTVIEKSLKPKTENFWRWSCINICLHRKLSLLFLLSVVFHSRFDGILCKHTAVQFHRWEWQVPGYVTVPTISTDFNPSECEQRKHTTNTNVTCILKSWRAEFLASIHRDWQQWINSPIFYAGCLIHRPPLDPIRSCHESTKLRHLSKRSKNMDIQMAYGLLSH